MVRTCCREKDRVRCSNEKIERPKLGRSEVIGKYRQDGMGGEECQE